MYNERHNKTDDPYTQDIYRDKSLISDLISGSERPFLSKREYERLKETRPEIIRKIKLLKTKKSRDFRELRLIADEVIGNLFNRVKFLKGRIDELETALNERNQINKTQVEEIKEDINRKNRKLMTLSNIDDIREFELDITNLQMEKRKEILTFWKDTLEVKRELAELKEEYENKSKIIAILQKEMK